MLIVADNVCIPYFSNVFFTFIRQLKVSTDKGFHIGGVVESIRIQGVQHPTTKRWECKDYIVVSNPCNMHCN